MPIATLIVDRSFFGPSKVLGGSVVREERGPRSGVKPAQRGANRWRPRLGLGLAGR